MIGRLYRWLFAAHQHEWETVKEQGFYTWESDVVGNKVKTGEGTLYTLRCKTCGDVSSRKVWVGS